MPYYSTLEETSQSRQMFDSFGGYNHNLRIAEGEWYDTKNLTSDYYPVMSQRGKRGLYLTLDKPQGIIAKDAIAYINDGVLYYNNISMANYMPNVHISEGEKTLLSMGAYLCVFPDGIYFNTENFEDNGYMGRTNGIVAASDNITYQICKMNGDTITVKTVGDTEPDNPANAEYWLDTSNNDNHVLKVYSSATNIWAEVATVYVKISATGIGTGLTKYDGVTISGAAAPEGSGESVKKQIEKLNGTVVIYDCGENYITVIGLLDAVVTQTSGTLKIAREVPDMDFVTECGNRLWGCKYGVVNGKTVNELYCCVLGDFKNWRRYLGVSTDAWSAGVGTDGRFTGAITHLGYPLFFKEDCVHKIYPSASGAHQVVTINCRGVQRGSERSLAIVNEVLYYKSRTDVCAFDGSLPQTVSTALGNEHFSDAHAGSCGDKYYVSMKNEHGEWNLFAYDVLKSIWIKEDGAQATAFTEKGNDLYMLTADGRVLTIKGTAGTPEETCVEWFAESGVIGFEYPDKKYLSRFNFRMSMAKGSKADFYLQYDSSGLWEHMGHIEGSDLRTFTLPIRPRRCDNLKMKISGSGEFKLYSIARILEVGSDY
jgi:hypothetical protein